MAIDVLIKNVIEFIQEIMRKMENVLIQTYVGGEKSVIREIAIDSTQIISQKIKSINADITIYVDFKLDVRITIHVKISTSLILRNSKTFIQKRR